MKKITSSILAFLMTATTIACTNAAEPETAAVTLTKTVASETQTVQEIAEEKNLGEILTLNFMDYCDGIVNSYDVAVTEDTTKDGKSAVKVTPNPKSELAKPITVDGWSYQKAGIDLKKFRYAAVEYYYDSPSPIKDGYFNLGILRSGKILKTSQYINSNEAIVPGAWAVATFSFENIGEQLSDETNTHVVNQMHLQLFTGKNVQVYSENDIMYISKIMFFENKPEFDTHTSYMNGYEDGSFRPSGTMTRAEACTVVARLLEAEENITGSSSFADVPADQWYAKYIGYCQVKKLLDSYSGNFEPNKPITRAEFSELVYLTGLAKDKGINASFTDVEGHAKYTSIMAAAKAGLINGYDNGNGTFSFKPDNTITRAEVVTIINRAKGTSKKQEQLTFNTIKLFTDVDETHWAFADIAEATVAHVESKGNWAFTIDDPIEKLAAKIGYDAVFDFAKTEAKISELDALEAKRIEEIRNTPNMDLSGITGKKIYVSASGNDNNDGLTENTPVKTAKKANTLAVNGDAILFKRGDLWREQFSVKSGITYTAYGEGAKPTFYGSPENGADETKWSLVYENKETGALIWMYEKQDMRDIGSLVFNEGEGFAVKENPSSVGSNYIVRGTKDTPFDYKKELDKNLEFFHRANSVYSSVIDPKSAVGPLYLRCDNGNPGKVFDSIEFIAYGSVISVGASNNVTIDNLCLKYSSFGIGSGGFKNLKVTNLEIGWIGGNVQSYTAFYTDGRATRYGNGIECYGSCDGYYVENCYIYQCYDAGVTHQGAAGKENNVTYKNNVLTDCVYNIEYFLGLDANNVDLNSGENILFEGNLCRRAGYGFGSMRPDANNQRHIRAGSGNNFSNFVIKNNIFDRAVHELVDTNVDVKVADKAPSYDGNVYIQGVGNGLYVHGADKSAKTDIAAAKSIANGLGDKNAEVYFAPYIPKYVYSYAPSKTVPVTESDRRKFEVVEVEEGKLFPEAGESTEVTAPLHIEVQKNKNIYKEDRKATELEVKTDEATGIVYNEVTINNDASALMFDCYGISPTIPTKNSYLYVKILMRTNQQVRPSINVYGMKDASGEKVIAYPVGYAVVPTVGNGEWEEVIIKVLNVPDTVVTTSQLHIYYAGENTKGSGYFKDGVFNGAKFDVAAWAVFENLASAQSFDLKKAASTK